MGNTTVIGLFETRASSDRAVDELLSRGFTQSEISLLSSAEGGPNIGPVSGIGSGSTAAEGAAVGGLGGFLIGMAVLAIPGVGPFLAAGPLAAGIMGASVGAAAGGLVTGLKKEGIPEEEAERYSEGVRQGHPLVTVRTTESRSDEAAAILDRNGAFDVEERAARWSKNPAAEALREPVATRSDSDLLDRVRDSDVQTGRTRGSGARMFVW